MIKIIKYSITFIIFIIIISLFVLYFYLLQGIKIENIHYKFINIGQLYIKIDKKIILKAKNIHILYKNQKKSSNEPIDFKKLKKTINKSIHTLAFFQKIDIKNLYINQYKFNSIFIKNNMLTINTNNLYLKGLVTIDKKNLFFQIYNLTLKKLHLKFNNIYTVCHFVPYQLDIKNSILYRDVKSKINITITNDKKIFYKGNIYNISKNTFYLLKNNLKQINYININNIYFNGNKDKVYFNVKNTIIKSQKEKLKIPLLSGDFDLNTKKLYINNNFSNINVNSNKINIYNTKIYYTVGKNGFVKNNQITIYDKNNKINIFKNKLFYTPNTSLLKSKKIEFLNNYLKANISNMTLKYLNKKNQFYTYIPNGKILYNKFKSNLKDIVITYNNQIKASIPFIKIKNNNINSIILNSYLSYKNNSLNIINDKIKFNYSTIKNLILKNIKTTYNIKNNTLNSNIPYTHLDNIKISNININLKNKLLNIFFSSHTILSKKLTNIFKLFKIPIPVYQTYGQNNIKGHISYDINKSKLNTDIKIDINNSKLVISKNSFLNIHHSNLDIKNHNIFLKNTLLDYNQSIININYYSKKAIINLEHLDLQSYGKFNTLNIKNILTLKNYPETIYIDLKKLNIFLPDLQTSIFLKKNIIVNINKISKLQPYISYLKQYNLNAGHIKLKIGKEINISSYITDTNQTILLKNLTPLKKLDINTTIKNNIYHIFNKNININIIDKNTTKIYGDYNNLDINITKFVNQKENNDSSDIQANIDANNTYILYKNIKLYSDKLHIDYDKNHTKIESLYKDRNISFNENNKNIKISGLNIKSKTFKDLTNSDILRNPLLDFYIIHNKDSKTIHGFIKIKKGYVKELKALTNILAFINLVPSLITFQPVGFSDKGYKLKKGYIEFMINNNIIYLKNISILGENMKFSGNGYINLNTHTLDIKIKVVLIIKLIKDIPIVNYILFGKNDGVTLKIKLKGDINDPKVSPNVTQNILSGPLNIIKRTIITPFRPFMEEK